MKKDFHELFDIHNYFLNLINKLSTVSLKILLDKDNWPTDVSGPTFQTGNMVITDWEKRFVDKYSDIVKIDENLLYISIYELRDNRIIEYSKQNKNVCLTKLGNNLFEYIDEK